MPLLKCKVVQSPIEGAHTEMLETTREEEEIRKIGIEVIGDAPWGTHFCQFYQNKEDLIDLLVPYFKAGLESNEFCMWVTSEPLSEKEAREAMRKAVPDFDRYVERGQIEIVPYTEWYLKDGAFNLQRVLNAWIDKHDQALAKGYDGLRVTGNTAWLEKRDWKSFADYEEKVNDAIGKYRMMAVCTYSLDKCGASEVIDVVRNHQFALFRRESKWELFESLELRRAKEQLLASEKRFQSTLDNMLEDCQIIGYDWRYLYVNDAVAKHGRTTKEKLLGKTMMEMYPGIEKTEVFSHLRRCMKERISIRLENEFEFPGGEKGWFDLSVQPVPEGIFILSIDITERKKAEEQIENANKEWRRTFDAISDFAFILDTDSRVVRVNKATCDFLKKEEREIIGKRCFEVLHGTDKPILNCPCEKLKVTRKSETLELSEPNLGLTLLVTASPIVDANGELIGCVHIARNITERRLMEKKLERQRDIAITLSGAGNLDEVMNRFFDNILEMEEFDCVAFYLFDEKTGALDMMAHRGLTDAFVEKVSHFDADSPYTKVVLNGKPVYQKTSDFPPPIREDLQSTGIRSVAAIPIHLKGEVIGHLNLASHTYNETSSATLRLLESIGAQIGETIVRARMDEKLRENEEKLRQYSENLEELVQKRTEELLESERRYSVLVEEASDGVVILQDGKIVFINKKGADIVGHSKDELIGFPFEKFVNEKFRRLARERYEQRLQGKMVPSEYEVELITKAGETVPVGISGKLIEYQGRPAILGICRDIRERKRMEGQRSKLEKLATIGELAAMVGHDLRNPLQSIENAAYYLNNQLQHLSTSLPNSKKTMEMLQAINNSVSYADRIIRDLQDYSATKKPIFTKTDINAIVKETLSQTQIPENVRVISELSQLPEIRVDKDQIKRVFLNIATNGIEAMERGGTLTVSTKKAADFVEVSFKDTGVGISKENLEKIFTPFFTTKSKGIGMGLSICKKFVENHGGSLRFESEVDNGTTFTVKLPIQQETEVKTIGEKQI